MKVIRGEPTEEEVAALVVALTSRKRPTPVPPSPQLDAWRLSVRQPGVRTRADW